MKFSEEQSHEVKLHHRDVGDLGEARLRFGGERGVVASLGLATGPRLALKCPLDFVTATTEDGHAFTLCECRIHGFSLIATFLVYGSITENHFLQIDVRYSDISEWFLRPERVEGTVGEQLSWTRRSQHFSAEVTEGVRRFTLSTKFVGSRERVGEDLVLHQHVEFSFESSNGFSLKEVREKAIELGALLSLLIAYPISIVSVEVYTKPDCVHPMYFGTFEELQRDKTLDFSIQCFLKKPRLDGHWPLILNNYYRDRERRDLWVRLAGMQRYEGFWDFRLVGFVALLDRYVAQRAQTRPDGPSAPSPQKIRDFGTALYKLSPKLDKAALNAIVGLAKRIFVSSSRSFPDQYAYAMDATDSEVRAVTDLTDEDFDLIKDVRDRIAHGEPPEIPDNDFTRISTIIGKIALLLTYWTFHDLGISKTEFLGAMNTTHNRLYLGASVNRKSLARATGTAPFFNVSTERFEQLTSRKDLRFDACFIEGPAGAIELSEEYTARWRSWHKNPAREAGVIRWETIFEVENDAVKYYGTVYIESGSQSMKLSSVCIFDKFRLHRSDKA